MLSFVHWYNHDHKHSGLKFISPAQRHRGEGAAIMANREAIYEAARLRNPARWSGDTRNWQLPDVVHLNPEKEDAVTKKAA